MTFIDGPTLVHPPPHVGGYRPREAARLLITVISGFQQYRSG